MYIEIETGAGLERSQMLDDHVRDRLGRVERVFGERLTTVRVFLKDVNAAKGGVDKACTMEARPAGHRPIAVEAASTDPWLAVRDAAGKLEKAIEHRLGREADRG